MSSNNQAASLFRFLRDYAKLRQKPIKNLTEYTKVIWLNDLPNESEWCAFRGWGADCGEVQSDNRDQWLKITRPERPLPPSYLEEIGAWVKKDERQNSSIDKPAIHDSIDNPEWEQDTEHQPQRLEIANHPEVRWFPSSSLGTQSWQP